MHSTAMPCVPMQTFSPIPMLPPAGSVQRIGESTELALRVFAEKVGLPSNMPPAAADSPRDFVCNKYWQEHCSRVATLEFSRDRKMMSVLAAQGDGRQMVWAKVRLM